MAAQLMAIVMSALNALIEYQGGNLTDEQLTQIRERTQAKVNRADEIGTKALGET